MKIKKRELQFTTSPDFIRELSFSYSGKCGRHMLYLTSRERRPSLMEEVSAE